MTQLPLSELLVRIATVVSAELRAAASEHDLKPVQLQALRYLAACNHYSDTPAALTDFLSVTKGTVSQTLMALERKGLVKKAADPVDGRIVRCSLTPAGRTIVRRSKALVFDELESEGLRLGLVELLAATQRKRDGRSFGVCSTCRYFETIPRGHRCGLTKEPLSKIASKKICREHLAP